MTTCCFLCKSSTPHVLLCRRIRFELSRFRSPLLTTSRLISSPAPTKMFQFGAFPIVLIQKRLTTYIVRMSHSGIPGSKIPCIYPGLIAAWHALHQLRKPSHPMTSIYMYTARYFHVTSYHTEIGKYLYTASYGCLLATICPSLQIYISRCIKNTRRNEPQVIHIYHHKKNTSVDWTRGDLNPRPRRCKRRALPAELRARADMQRDRKTSHRSYHDLSFKTLMILWSV